VAAHERQRLPLRQRCFEPPTLSAVLTEINAIDTGGAR
jgi:hypothetical protein